MSGRASRHVHAHVVAETARALPGFAPTRRLCLGCGRQRPLFRFRQVVKADADHTLCFQCYRALHQRLRAVRMRAVGSGHVLPSVDRGAALVVDNHAVRLSACVAGAQ